MHPWEIIKLIKVHLVQPFPVQYKSFPGVLGSGASWHRPVAAEEYRSLREGVKRGFERLILLILEFR